MSIPGFDEWLATPQGRYVLEWEQARFDQLVADIFGFNAVQIGLPQCDFLRANRMPLRCTCDTAGPARVVSDPHHLPFAGNSVDLVVLPHVLEFSATPHQVLREVERVLVPEGQVVIAGFNPFSLWGIKRRLAGSAAAYPWRGQYLSVRRLRDWLTLLSFETQAGCFGRYIPAVSQEKWLRRWRFLELAGDRWWPIAGAVYILQGIKRQHGLRLLTPVWHDRKARAKALLPAIQKTQKTEQ
ncbi:MAG: class I SAM-dependent methyltransferase [Rhodocyclales bacterium]|nr:class I SAM-dependent methyltransferase [Rhodocyclales bacterium]